MKRKIRVNIIDVEKAIQTVFPEFNRIVEITTPNCRNFQNMYYFGGSNTDLVIAVKVGDPLEDHALHVIIMKHNKKNGELRVIYPTEKLGTGHFQSKMIQRTEGWDLRMIQEIRNGMKESLKIWVQQWKDLNPIWRDLGGYIDNLYHKSIIEKWIDNNNCVHQMCAFCHDLKKREYYLEKNTLLDCDMCFIHHSICDDHGNKGYISTLPAHILIGLLPQAQKLTMIAKLTDGMINDDPEP